jgi:hypothetical protein
MSMTARDAPNRAPSNIQQTGHLAAELGQIEHGKLRMVDLDAFHLRQRIQYEGAEPWVAMDKDPGGAHKLGQFDPFKLRLPLSGVLVLQ